MLSVYHGYQYAYATYSILRKNNVGSAFLPTSLPLRMTPCCWWIPTHASKSRPPGELAPETKAAGCAQRTPSRKAELHLACSVNKLFIHPELLASLHFKVAVYVCLAKLPGVLSLCPQICHPHGCLLYSGHTVQVHIHWCLKVLTVLTAFGGYLQEFRLNLNLGPYLAPMPMSRGWYWF